MTLTQDFTSRFLILALTNHLSIPRGYLTQGRDFAQPSTCVTSVRHFHLAASALLGISANSLVQPDVRSRICRYVPLPLTPFRASTRQLSTIRRYAPGHHHPHLGLSVVVGTSTVAVYDDCRIAAFHLRRRLSNFEHFHHSSALDFHVSIFPPLVSGIPSAADTRALVHSSWTCTSVRCMDRWISTFHVISRKPALSANQRS